MSDWDPNWPEFLKSLGDDNSASASSSAAPVAAPHRLRIPTSNEILERLNEYIKEYFVELELSGLARRFTEEAQKTEGIPPVPFVQAWIQLESEIAPLSAPPSSREMAVMIPLNKGIKKYLDFLEIDKRSFEEKAWIRAERPIRLIETWVERIYPRYATAVPMEEESDSE